MAKIVVDNTSPEGRQLQLEAQVQVAWAKVAGDVLNFLIGRETSVVSSMREFIAVHDAAVQESVDPNGIVIRGPELGQTTKGHPDAPIDTVLTGSLSMVTAMLQVGAKRPVSDPGGTYSDDTAYVAALAQIVRGIAMLQEKTRKTPRR